MHVSDEWNSWQAAHPEADEATFHAGWNKAIRHATEIQSGYEKTRAHRLIDVFENAEEDALAEEIMQDVFDAIGLLQTFGVAIPSDAGES